MRFRSVLDIPCGIRHIYSNLTICSPLSRALLLESEMHIDVHSINREYTNLKETTELLNKQDFANRCERLRIKLSQLKDIRNSVKRLNEGSTLDDIELFEVKSLALINYDVNEILSPFNLSSVKLTDLKEVLNILDPDVTRITSFYVYDSYSQTLTKLRRDYKLSGYSDNEIAFKISEEEQSIRERLSSNLVVYAKEIINAMNSLAYTDILLAKATQIRELGLIIPEISDNKTTSYRALFNPEIVDILKKEKREYQRTDITFGSESPLLITGSNMGGKTVTLKTLALAQYLFQFGFGIPATEAEIAPVSEIFLSCGDEQDYRAGLSSFAAEMKRIDKMIKSLRRGKFILSLTDEPARTTNPVEGEALARSLISILSGHSVMSVMTTHYNIKSSKCRRLRVVGFENGKMNYSLVHDSGEESPHEALMIAESLGIDPEWIALAQKIIKNEN